MVGATVRHLNLRSTGVARGPVDGSLTGERVRAGVVVEVAGLEVELDAADDARAEAVASLLRHARIRSGPADCRIVFGVEAPEVPDRAPDVMAEGQRRWDADGTAWFALDGGPAARVDASDLVVGGGGPGLATWFRNLCFQGLGHLFAARGRLLLHGAALLADDGAVLVLGDSGAGKSTLALAAARAGWGVLGDDAVVVGRASAAAGLEAVGVPRPPAFPHDVLPEGGLEDGHEVPDDPRRRVEAPAGSLTGGAHPIRELVVARGADPRGPGVDPLTGREALDAVLRAATAFADPSARPLAFAFAGELARLPRCALRRGSDPTRAVAEIGALLDVLPGRATWSGTA